jgi:hypothetical protein
MSKWTRLGAAAAALAVTCASVAVAQTPGAPENDNYLQSLRLNDPGDRLERTDTLRDVRDTTNATTQADVFAPPSSGGPAEPTDCEGAQLGKTVWYDFYPDVRGLTRIRASGFDTTIAVVPFNRTSGVPDFSRRLCFNSSNSTTEEALIEVREGGSYTIQLGGVNGAGGSLEFLFDFLADVDGDGVLDDNDRCRTLAGSTKSGCPPRLRADSVLRAQPTTTGIKVLALSVTAPRRARVAVSCTRGACPAEVKKAHSTVKFRRVRGRSLPAGSKLVIRVTKRRSIGSYIAYRVERGNFKKIERCLNPGSRKPRKRCG